MKTPIEKAAEEIMGCLPFEITAEEIAAIIRRVLGEEVPNAEERDDVGVELLEKLTCQYDIDLVNDLYNQCRRDIGLEGGRDG